MTNLKEQPLHGIAIYNPDLLSKQELIARFSARTALLKRLVEDLGRKGSVQHHLLIGQRGMGKTTLLRRLRYAVEDDPVLQEQWVPLTFPEEQYNVSRLSDLYLNCIDALGDALERSGNEGEARKLDELVAHLPDRKEAERAKRALEVLLSAAKSTGRRLLLLIDNIDLILDRLKSDQWGLREVLSPENGLLVIGASSTMIESTYEYKEPFYDFFQMHDLKGLTEEGTREVLRTLSRLGGAPQVERVLEEDPARIRTLHVLAGGNPRTVVLLYNVLASTTEGNVRSDLEQLLDQCTPLYKARFEAMPAQSQLVVDALAIHWDPISAGELAVLVRLDTNAVSSQLNRLVQQGVVEKVSYHPSSKTGFQVAERFFNIWYLMRANRRVRQQLIWLVNFLPILYGLKHAIADHHTIHTPAPIFAHQAKWSDTAPLARQIFSDGSPKHCEKFWPDILIFFREAIRTDHAADALKLLNELPLADRWRPLREALNAIAENSRLPLRRVAPEIRLPAEQLITELLPEGKTLD